MGPSHVAEAARLRGEDRLGVNLITDAMMAVMEADDPGLSLNAVAEDRGWFESSIDETAVKQAVQSAVSGSKLAGKYARGNTKGFSTILKHVATDAVGRLAAVDDAKMFAATVLVRGVVKLTPEGGRLRLRIQLR